MHGALVLVIDFLEDVMIVAIRSTTSRKSGGNEIHGADAIVHRARKITPYLLALASASAIACSMETAPASSTSWHAAATPSASSSASSSTSKADAGASVPADAGTTTNADPTAEMDDGPALASLTNGIYKTSPAFTKVSSAPYASAATSGAYIDVWVSTQAYEAYSGIRPDILGSHEDLQPGAMIVREVLNGQGTPTKLTLMIKGPAGYNPALGDWWFGETDPNGVPMSDDAGVLTGRMTACFSCHIPRKDDGYLFGVQAGARMAHP